MSFEYHFELIYMTADGPAVLYPKTLAEQVLLTNGQNALDHINSDMHLRGAERAGLDACNLPGGFVKLDARGYVPKDLIKGSLLAIGTEFATIHDMLEHGAEVISGGICMVVDATEDPNIRHKWGIYRRKLNSDAYWSLDGWECICNGQSIDLSMAWEDIEGVPDSTGPEIDDMVSKAHTHPDKILLDNIAELNNHANFKGHEIAYYEEVPQFITSDYDNGMLRIGDFWLKHSYGQQWWTDPTIEYAGDTCYEKYMGLDTMREAPKLRTSDSTSFCRMFYRDYDLEGMQQYDTAKGVDFTQMFYECTSLHVVPCMATSEGEQFDEMFYKTISLEYSPEMDLSKAVSVKGMYSGCEVLEYVLPFKSTSHVTNMIQWFNGCSSLKKIFDPIDFSSITSEARVASMFNQCLDLEEVEFVENTLKVSLSLENTNLTRESLLGILQGLPTVTNSPTLTLTGIPNLSTISESDFQTARVKGWTLVL